MVARCGCGGGCRSQSAGVAVVVARSGCRGVAEVVARCGCGGGCRSQAVGVAVVVARSRCRSQAAEVAVVVARNGCRSLISVVVARENSQEVCLTGPRTDACDLGLTKGYQGAWA